MAVSPDFAARAGAADEGIVRGNHPVRPQAHHLALQLVEVLRGGTLVVLAQGDEQVAITVEHKPRAKVVTHRQLGLLAEDHLDLHLEIAVQQRHERPVHPYRSRPSA